MLNLGDLTKNKVERENQQHAQNANKVAKELFLELIEKQLTFQESMLAINIMRDSLATWGSNWLDQKYLTHIRDDLKV